MKSTYIFSSIILLFLYGCNNESSNTEFKKSSIKNIDSVSTEIVKATSFQKELITNGKLEAIQKTELQFAINGIVARLDTKSGQRIKKEQLIAQLEDSQLTLELERAKFALEKAKLEYKDVLIGQGYDPNDIEKTPKDFQKIAGIKSGLNEAKLNLQKAQQNIDQSQLRAPFSGVIANLSIKKYDQINAYKSIAELISNDKFYVKFSILESNYSLVHKNQRIKVATIDGKEYLGVIDHINPKVNENGLITVFGKVANQNGQLIEGMNVNVWVFSEVKNQLVVPKSAVQKRDGQNIVFTIENDSVAYWNYVTIGLENSTQVTIIEGLKKGDKIIISNNENLAHKSIVKTKKTESK